MNKDVFVVFVDDRKFGLHRVKGVFSTEALADAFVDSHRPKLTDPRFDESWLVFKFTVDALVDASMPKKKSE